MGQVANATWWLLALVLFNAYTSYFVGGWASIRFSGRQELIPGSMVGKVVIVTGANTGIGLGVVRELLLLGATVVLCCRSLQKGHAAKATLPPGSKVEVMELDLGRLASIRTFSENFASKYAQLDVLVLNAGVARSFQGNQGFQLTSDGLEEMVGVNFLGHFYLTKLLLPLLRKTQGARVIANSSVAGLNSYSFGIDVKTWFSRSKHFQDWKQYGQSKLALILFIRALQKKEPGLLCLACHPGVVKDTKLMHAEQSSWLESLYTAFLFNCLAMRPEDGWRSTVHLASAAREKLVGGGLYWPVGSLVRWPMSRLAVIFQRVGALQASLHVEQEHDNLWDEAETTLAKLGAKTKDD